jgi:hypothetical protein
MNQPKYPSLFLVFPLVFALGGCGGNVVAQPSGPGGGGDGGQPDGGGGQGGSSSTTAVSSSSAGGSGGTASCKDLSEIACLGAYPSCVPVYDDMCCPMCDPMAGCADCVNWAFHHCATQENGCLPEQPIECGTVPGWACVGGSATCEPQTGSTKTPCATVPGCVASYCPTDMDCTTDPICIPVDKDLCGPATCEKVPPACPDGTTPAVEAGCFTGGCIFKTVCGQ